MYKELSIGETKNIIQNLQNKLELYLRKKQINFDKTQPKSSKIKDIVVSNSNTNFDCFTTYMIKDEECDDKIYKLQQEILAYQTYLNKEIMRMKKNDDLPLIVYLKEEEKMSWREIDKLLNHGEDYSRTKYKRYKKEQKMKLTRFDPV